MLISCLCWVLACGVVLGTLTTFAIILPMKRAGCLIFIVMLHISCVATWASQFTQVEK